MLHNHYDDDRKLKITIGACVVLVVVLLSAAFLVAWWESSSTTTAAVAPRPGDAYQGYAPDPDGTDQFLDSLDKPNIQDAAPEMFEARPDAQPQPQPAKKGVLLYRPLRKAHLATYKTEWRAETQGIGDCVSWGSAYGIAIASAVEWSLGNVTEWKMPSTEAIYGGSRVEARGLSGDGKQPLGGWQDGSYGAAAAKWIHNRGGILFRQKYERFDLTRYDAHRAKQWGAYGCGGQNDSGWADELARKVPVKSVAQVKTFEGASAAIDSGYPVFVCSTQGFSHARDRDGFASPSGSWAHCFPSGTIVNTYPFPKPIEEIMVGDVVVTHSGRLMPVTETMERQFEGTAITLRVAGCTDIVATSEHPILIYRPMTHESWAKPANNPRTYSGGKYAQYSSRKMEYEDGQPQWMPIGSVRADDYVLVPRTVQRNSAQIPEWRKAARSNGVPSIITQDSDFAYLCGYYIANGSASASHKIQIVLPSESSAKNRLIRAVEKLGLKATFDVKPTFERMYVYNAILADAFLEWFGHSANTKRIPEFLLTDGWDWQALLDGYSNGDGCVLANGRVRITTVSTTLAHQVWMIAVHLGQYPVMDRIKANRPGAYANAKPSLSVEFGREPIRKTTRYWQNFYCLPVRDVQGEPYSGKVYNIEVDQDHSYVASGVIVHNCMVFVGTRYDRPGLLCLNSWGEAWISGPVWPSDQPAGTFWVDAATVNVMLRNEYRGQPNYDSFAVSAVAGFAYRPLDNGDWVQAPMQRQQHNTGSDRSFVLAP